MFSAQRAAHEGALPAYDPEARSRWAKALLTQVTGLAMLARAGEMDDFWEGLARSTAWRSRLDVQLELLRALAEAGGDDVPVDREAEIDRFVGLVAEAAGPAAASRMVAAHRRPPRVPRPRRRCAA